ncbi:hypothetical protein GCM10023075_39770 [Streptosporangium album]
MAGSVLIRGSVSTCCASACRVTSQTRPPGSSASTSGASSRRRPYSAGDGPVKQFEARLAVIALILGSFPFVVGLDLPEEERAETALTVAAKLISGQ